MTPGCALPLVSPHLPHQLPLVWQQRLLERPGADAGGADGSDGGGAVGGVTRRLRCPPSTATAQCARGFGAKARAGTKKFVRHGGRGFLYCATDVPRAFRPKARSHCTITALGGQLGCGLPVAPVARAALRTCLFEWWILEAHWLIEDRASDGSNHFCECRV